MVQVGQHYVYGRMICGGFAPTVCASEYSPKHPCRVLVEKVGRKYAYVRLTGYRGLQAIPFDMLWPVDEAKQLYRKALEAREEKWRQRGSAGLGQKKVDQLVEGL